MRCVAYCRVSTDNKDQLNSLEAQKNYFNNLFNEDKYNPSKCGMIYKKDGTIEAIQGIYADEGITGTSTKRREAFKQMLNDAKLKKFDVIYVKSISRFTRDMESITILRDLKALGIDVKFIQEGFTLLGTDEFTLGLFINLSNRESVELSNRVKWGIRERQKQGKSRSPHIFGYEKVDGDFKIYPKEAEIVKEIFSLYLQGKGYNAIARELTDREIPTKTGAKWRNNTINGIIENPIYFGKVRSHVREVADVNRKIVKMVDDEDIILADRPDLAIFSQAEYEEVLRVINSRKKQKREGSRSSHKYLLSNVIKCKNCGGGFRRKKYKFKDGVEVYHWVCIHADMYGKKFCDTRTAIREDLFLEEVKNRVRELQERDLEELFNVYLDVKYGNSEDNEKLKQLEEDRNRLNRKKDLYIDEYAEGVYTMEEYKDKVKVLNDKLKAIRGDIEALSNITLTIDNERKKYNEYMDYLKGLDIDNITNVDLKKVFSHIEASTVYENGKKLKIFKFIPIVFGMSLEELIEKAVQIGYKFALTING